MIKVVFKNMYDDIYGSKEYTYRDYEGVSVGDIVVVNTKGGYSIAKVTKTDIVDFRYKIEDLQSIEKIIISQKELEEKQKEEYEKQEKLNKFINETKRKTLLDKLKTYNDNKEYSEFLDTLSLEELEKLNQMII